MPPVAKSKGGKAKGTRDKIQENEQEAKETQNTAVPSTKEPVDNAITNVSTSTNLPSTSQSVKFGSKNFSKDGLIRYNRNEIAPRQNGYSNSTRSYSGVRWQARLKYLQQRAQEAVPALRIRGIDFMEKLEEPVEITEDGERCLVQFPEEIFDALTEVLSNSTEITLIYKAMQPLVGMVFGKHGSAAHQLHEMGATLELASKDRFHIKCPHATARKVQDFFEEKLAKALVRLNSDRVTVVMRPEKLMIMLSPFCLTPVVVLGMLTDHLLVLRIYDLEFEERFARVHKDMQAYYGSLSNSQLLDVRLSLPITIGSLACYFDDKSHAFVRVVVEDVMESLQPPIPHTSPGSSTLARIWKMDYGSFECVSVDQLYRLQTCYLTVPRQCFVARLLYAKKQVSCDLTAQDIYFRYFSSKRLFALSVMENPSDLSHVILLYRDRAPNHAESEPTPPLDELKDILPVMVSENVYQVLPYSGVDFSSQLDGIKPLHTDIPYSQLCRASHTSRQSNQRTLNTAETALQELVCPYERNPEKRFVFKYHGLNMSEEERALKMHFNAPSLSVKHTNSSADVTNVSQSNEKGGGMGTSSSSGYVTQEKMLSLESGAGMASAAASSMYPPLINSFNMYQPQLSHPAGGIFTPAFLAPIWPNSFMNGMMYPNPMLGPSMQPPFSSCPTYLCEPWASVAAMFTPSPSLQFTPNYATPWMFSMPSSALPDSCVSKDLH